MVSPYLIYQFWAFVGPAFTASEKRYFVPVVAACSALFLGGVASPTWSCCRVASPFCSPSTSEYFNVQNRASDYFTFVALFLLAFGLTFEMPVVLVLLAKVGVVDDRSLRKNRRYAILVEAVVAAVLTPSQDAFSMLALFVPLVDPVRGLDRPGAHRAAERRRAAVRGTRRHAARRRSEPRDRLNRAASG